MARRSQCSSAGDNPLNPNYLPPHYREEYRLAVDALVEEDLDGYYQFLLKADVVDFLSAPEIEYIQGAIRLPQHGEHPEHLEQRFPEGGADGSSDTYWPLHSDLDAPGLDLGWPQTHHFIGPTEVTTLVNPPEPDMPSIKEQARRLIKNANQVVAIAMDMFTDVDIFADILGAAMRNVAVYVLLDKENVHHFINMAANCRVDLHAVQFLRVRTVSGITYRCRSGKTFTGQMMDRFLLTDCRAVLSGNYSFMWSYEKLHRCMAHLFLGQLVSTFDEEFRILFAQSEPLVIDNPLPPIEDFSQPQRRKYSSERPLLYREPRKFMSLDTPHPDEWGRHPHEDQMDLDWRMAPLKRQEAAFGSSEVYGRFVPQQSRLDPSFDQGAPRMLMMENPAFKRHSYAEGGQGRYSLPYLQPEPENQGRQLHRAQQPYPDYSGYDRFWNQDFDSADAYCEPGLPPEIERRGSFDPVLNYLSTRNPDLEQAPEKIPPAADLRFSSSQPRRLSLGQPYACQTSPTSSNPSDQKAFLFEPSPDRKDPTVKRGLRNWRISSFLSASDNPGDDGLPSTPPNAPDAFEEPCDLSVPKIPNVREFKIPALPRASQMPSFTKTAVKEPPKIAPVEPAAEPKLTPTPSESSSTTEGERTEEAEPKETKALQREESFRRKYNPAIQRSSRLRSSLIFSSLDQQHPTNPNPGQQDVEGDKNEAEQKKLPFMSQVIGQRKSATREPIEWSRYLKSSTFDVSPLDTPKEDGQDKVDNKDIINYNRGAKEDCKDIEGHEKDSKADHKDDKDSGKDQHLREPSENIKAAPVEQVNPSVPEAPKCDPASQAHKPLFMSPVCLDMNDPDQRLMFFKELAAQRRAAKAAEAEPKKPAAEPTNVSSVKHDKDPPAEPLETSAEASQCLSGKDAAAKDAEKTESSNFISQHPNQTVQKDQLQNKDLKTTQSSKDQQTRTLIGLEVNELKSQSGQSLPVSAETQTQTPQSGEEMQLHPAVSSTASDPVPDHLPPEALNTKDSQSPQQESTSHHQPVSACSETILPSCEQLSQPEGSCSTKQPTSSPAESKPANSGPAESTKPGILSLNVKESLIQSGGSLPGMEASSISQSQTAVDHVHPISSLVVSEIIHDSKSLELPEEVRTEHQQHFEGGLDSPKLIGPSEQVKSEGREPIGPSEQVKAEGREVIGPSEQVKTGGSEVIGPSEQVEAEGSEVIGPSGQVKTEGSEVIGPSEQVEAEGSEVIGPSGQVKTEGSEVIGPSEQLKAEDSEVIGPSEQVKAEGSEGSEVIGPSGQVKAEDSEVIGPSEQVKAEGNEAIGPSEQAKAEGSEVIGPSGQVKAEGSEVIGPSEHVKTEGSEVIGSSGQVKAEGSEVIGPLEQAKAEGSEVIGLSGQVVDDTLLVARLKDEQRESSSHPNRITDFSGSSDPPTDFFPSQAPPSEWHLTPGTTSTGSGASPPTPDAEQTQTLSDCVSENSPASSLTSGSVTAPTGEPSAECVHATAPPAGSPVLDNTHSESEDKGVLEMLDQTDPSNLTIESQETSDQSSSKPDDPAGVTSEEVVPSSPQSKQSKSRYHSSTANVLSSSNLRDDTKLLLEQISVNSQNRNESSKESAVTDDDKEGEANKKAKREKAGGIHSLSRGPPKSSEEREKVLERIQSMRKERKVYSRFEMAP